jgi:hypothetical protein
MASLDIMIAALDEAHREFAFVFEGLADEDVWRRPDPNLLSVGELAGHAAHWEAVRFVGPGATNSPDLSQVRIKSPLVDSRFRYYSTSIGEPVVLPMTAAEVLAEVTRVHHECKAAITQAAPDTEALFPGSNWATWGNILTYQAFHVAYHTGQAYSVRHLLGHTTTDN